MRPVLLKNVNHKLIVYKLYKFNIRIDKFGIK